MRSSLFNRLIVASMVALPIAPVLFDYFGPSTYSRWLLADAANQFDRGNVEQAQKSIEKAYSLSKDIVLDGNFWRQFERIENDRNATSGSTKIWEEILRQVEDENQRSTAAMEISTLLSNRQRFDGAARILAQNLPPREKRTPIQNNQIAYMRALAQVDLDEALLDVNQALIKNDNESFLDTKAWVLHQLGRDEEALPIIDKSLSLLLDKWRGSAVLEPFLNELSALEKSLNGELPGSQKQPVESDSSQSEVKTEDSPTEQVASAEVPATDPPESSPAPEERPEAVADASKDPGWAEAKLMSKFPLVARNFPEITDLIATLRFHRMRILEGLGRNDEAEKELRWLRAFSTKALDEMF